MAAAQALDFREHKFGDGIEEAKKVIRKHVEFLDEDRPLYKDHDAIKALVKSKDIVLNVEKKIGAFYVHK